MEYITAQETTLWDKYITTLQIIYSKQLSFSAQQIVMG